MTRVEVLLSASCALRLISLLDVHLRQKLQVNLRLLQHQMSKEAVNFVRFEILNSLRLMMTPFFWDTTPRHSAISCRRFEGYTALSSRVRDRVQFVILHHCLYLTPCNGLIMKKNEDLGLTYSILMSKRIQT
jgi:hypothetical protein